MRFTKLFTRTTKENPADEVSINAQLLERGGFVYKNSAGIYTYMPLGFRVLEKIRGIIREEMNIIGNVGEYSLGCILVIAIILIIYGIIKSGWI